MQLPSTDSAYILLPTNPIVTLALIDIESGDTFPIPVPPSSLSVSIRSPNPPDDGSTLFRTLVPEPEQLILAHLMLIHSILRLPPAPHYGPISLNLDPTYDGIAATSGGSIGFSTAYLAQLGRNTSSPAARLNEISGVLLHELVHVVQWNGKGTAPWWWIEGLADMVRLRGGLAPPHWCKPGEGDSWKNGYDRTARFLDWLDSKSGPSEGFCSTVNAKLRESKWDDKWWEELTGKTAETLWKEYKAVYELTAATQPPDPVPTHAA